MESIGILLSRFVMASLDLNFNLPGTMKYENARTSRAFFLRILRFAVS
jgi:hypothetical protein